MKDVADYRVMLTQLKNKEITPRSVVGTGYVNARKVALEWLYLQIINGSLNKQYSDVYAASSGLPFKSINKAMSSSVLRINMMPIG
jgi:hypothetical protein